MHFEELSASMLVTVAGMMVLLKLTFYGRKTSSISSMFDWCVSSSCPPVPISGFREACALIFWAVNLLPSSFVDGSLYLHLMRSFLGFAALML
jgi:hypothetical protein